MKFIQGLVMGPFGFFIQILNFFAATKGKTSEQKRVIRYFTAAYGCLGALLGVDDAEFDSILTRRVQQYNVFQMALAKLGLDVNQVQEVTPVLTDGYHLGSQYERLGQDLVYRSSKYQLSCVLFGDAQVYLYSFIFDLASGETTEHTEEYFYQDVTSVATNAKTKDIPYNFGCLKHKLKYINVPSWDFQLVVPGDSFVCAMRENYEHSIFAMRAKLREKKES